MTVTELQRALAKALDPEVAGTYGLSTVNKAILGVILLSFLVGVLMTEETLLIRWPGVFLGLEVAFFMVFLVEYLARLWCAPLNPRRGGRIRFLLSPAALLDLAVLVSMVLPLFGLEAALLRAVRAARILRLARLGRFSMALRELGRALTDRGYELMVGLGAALFLLLLAATGLYLLEGTIQPAAFGSIPRALWWAVATLTTVGYGDVVPITAAGRILAALTALCGVAVIAIPTGIIAAAFTEVIQSGKARAGKNGDKHDA